MEPFAYAVANILECWKLIRREFTGLDLSRLDLSKVSITNVICSRLFKNSYLAARFDGALIPAKSIFSGSFSNDLNSLSNDLTNSVYSPDGKKVLSISVDDTLKEWDVTNGKCLRVYNGHLFNIENVTYNSDGTRVLSSSWDGTIKEWDVETGKSLQTFIDIPGLWVQGCSFLNLHPKSQLTAKLVKTQR